MAKVQQMLYKCWKFFKKALYKTVSLNNTLGSTFLYNVLCLHSYIQTIYDGLLVSQTIVITKVANPLFSVQPFISSNDLGNLDITYFLWLEMNFELQTTNMNA